MRKQVMRMSAMSLAVLCGSTAALAQDSTGLNDGAYGAALGDGVRPHAISEQCNQYVVDLAPLAGSWGTMWGIAPIAKSSQFVDAGGNSQFFSGLTSSQFLSSDMVFAGIKAEAGGAYEVWSAAGDGVNHEDGRNSVPSSALALYDRQMSYVFSEFGNTEDDTIVSGFIRWNSLDNPGRLYVTRVNTAISGEAPATGTFSTYGVGSCDASGNVYFRADNFGRTGDITRQIGSQWVYRVDMANRNCATLNVIDKTNAITSWFAGDGDPDGWHDEAVTFAPVFPPIAGNPPSGNDTHLVPNCVPASFAGVPSVFTSNFAGTTPGEFVYDGSAGAASVAAQGTVVPGIFDTRGSCEWTRHDMFSSAGSVATGGIISKVNANDASATRIAIWGVDAVGAPSAPGADFSMLNLPLTVSDPCDVDPTLGGNFQLNRAGVGGADYDGTPDGTLFPAFFYDNYHGAAAFRGVTSQVALGQDDQGNNLCAAVVYYSAVRDDDQPGNALVVTKFGQNGASQTHTLAAWNNYPDIHGKPIYDGIGGNQIGELCSFEDMSANNLRALGSRSGGGIGPSMTPAGFDSYGNLYFVSPVQIYRGANADNDIDAALFGSVADLFPMIDTNADNMTDSPNPERDLWEIGLVRAVYDQAAFCYRLELVARTGQVFHGKNSDTDYMIDSIQVSGGTSLAASAFGSGNVNEMPMHGVAPVAATADDARHLGGLVVMADIIYNADGTDTHGFPPVDVATLPLDSAEWTALGAKDFPESVGGSGAFEDPTASFGVGVPLHPDSNDQAYSALLFVGNQEGIQPAVCTPCANVDGSPDQSVSLGDLNIVLFNFGSSGNTPGTMGDTDCDGDTDLADLNNVLFSFGSNVGC
ncbi:MAG: hypothetical protein KDA20_07410 [Phycisphaerales bacterium]|nr:hypothetical protein [Phycisphaerales bacterium]